MQKTWPLLKTPPVVLAIFQITFEVKSNDLLEKLLMCEKDIINKYPKKTPKFHDHINLNQGTPTPGIRNLKSNLTLDGYIFSSKDEKNKIALELGSVTYSSESQYSCWDDFTTEIKFLLKLITPFIESFNVNRTSIRFINKFKLNPFSDPLEFFTKTISSETGPGNMALHKYAFTLNYLIPNTSIYTIINHAVEPTSKDSVDYYFDIDVLDPSVNTFKNNHILKQIDKLRNIKNDIFFDTLQQKTLDLCNS